jgi:hypothetical protein
MVAGDGATYSGRDADGRDVNAHGVPVVDRSRRVQEASMMVASAPTPREAAIHAIVENLTEQCRRMKASTLAEPVLLEANRRSIAFWEEQLARDEQHDSLRGTSPAALSPLALKGRC